MAQISVIELLTDPDFCDLVTIIRSTETVGDDGVAVYTTQTVQVMASIQANSGDTLMMLPDASRTEGTWEIITTYPLATATDTTKADTVIWRGVEHVVTSIGRFGNFAGGFGHYEGVMELKKINAPVGAP